MSSLLSRFLRPSLTRRLVSAQMGMVLVLWLVTFWLNGELWMPLLLSMPLLLIPAWLSVRLALRPFRALAEEVAGKGPQDPEPLMFVAKHHELHSLVGSFNMLLRRVRESTEYERRSTTEVPHEPRAPFVAMSIQAEPLPQHPNNPDTASLLEGLLNGGERATRLASQLLSLMHSDANAPRMQSQRLKLDELVQDQIAALSPIAKRRDVELAFDFPTSPVWLQGEQEGLQSLVSNIVANAINYSPHGGLVTAGVVSDEVQTAIMVTDKGPGIAASIRKRVFERFYRAPDQIQQSTGLGIAIVKAVSDRHGVIVSYEEPEGGSLRVRIAFTDPQVPV